MKKIYIIQIIFTLIGNISIAQTPLFGDQLLIHTSCADAKLICGEFSENEGIYDSIVAYNGCSLDAQYFKFYSNNSIGSLHLNTNNTGTYTLYGPFSGFGAPACSAIETNQANEVTGALPPSSQISLDSGYYILKVKIDCIGPNGESIIPTVLRFVNIGVYSRSITCDFPPPECIDCIGTFSPDPGKYIISAWVKGKEENKNSSYENPEISISFVGGSNNYNFSPSGLIIDGWQRIDGVVEVPNGATSIKVELSCSSGDCYFDDIRFVPIDGSMKSYVYDPITQKLVAELDERNYATFYEYDEEGKLIRVKKETEKGIMTIKENRDNISK